MKNVKYFFILIFIIFVFTGCETFTVRSSPEAFRTGKVLEEGEVKAATNSILLLFYPIPLLEGNVTVGLPYDTEATVGWGVHGLTTTTGESEENGR